MEIRQGWSGQVSQNPDRWAKTDIRLDETDLRRLLTAGKIDPAVADSLPVDVVWTLLDAEAERLTYKRLVRRFGYPEADAAERVAGCVKTIDDLIALIKEKTSS
jgi:hypothetical protein